MTGPCKADRGCSHVVPLMAGMVWDTPTNRYLLALNRLLGGGGLLGAFGQWLGNRTSGRKLAQLEGLAGAQQQQATRAAAQAAGALLAQATAGGRRGGNNSQATSSAPPKPSWSLWEALPDQLPSLSTWRDPRSRDAAGASSAGGAQDGFDGYYSSISEPDITAFSGPPDYEGINSTTIKSNSYGNSSVNVTGTRRHDPQGDPYGQFTLVIMTASQAAATRVQALLAPVLQRVGLQVRSLDARYSVARFSVLHVCNARRQVNAKILQQPAALKRTSRCHACSTRKSCDTLAQQVSVHACCMPTACHQHRPGPTMHACTTGWLCKPRSMHWTY
jgi:hypothetical protein